VSAINGFNIIIIIIIYNLNTKHCYSQITYEQHYVHMQIHVVTFPFGQPISCPPFASFSSPYTACPPVYLLGDSSSFARGANTHPLLSLVGFQLFSPCGLTHPKGTPQIKLHIYIDHINQIGRPVWYTNDSTILGCRLKENIFKIIFIVWQNQCMRSFS
jgi:hypothetical protein